jgi:hypothetical protein
MTCAPSFARTMNGFWLNKLAVAVSVDRRDSKTILPATWLPARPPRTDRLASIWPNAHGPQSLTEMLLMRNRSLVLELPQSGVRCWTVVRYAGLSRAIRPSEGIMCAEPAEPKEISKDQTDTGEPELPLLGQTEGAFVIDHSFRPRTGTGIWHRWTVIIPSRSIHGGFVWGTVWRRTNRRRWLYKKFK